MKIYTKTGDNGETGFIGGRISKASDMIDVVGELDEVNAVLGAVVAQLNSDKGKKLGEVAQYLEDVQRHMFELGALVANPRLEQVKSSKQVGRIEDWVAEMESQIDTWELSLPPLQNFILPGGDKCGAKLHEARAVCRRAERTLVRLMQGMHNQPEVRANYTTTLKGVQRYLNRLSDLLFVAARYVNLLQKSPEQIWSQDAKQVRMEFS